MSEKIVLIDGHSILNRAFYGVPDLTNAEGLHTNAVYGFLNILFKILEEEKPEYLTEFFCHRLSCSFIISKHLMTKCRCMNIKCDRQILRFFFFQNFKQDIQKSVHRIRMKAFRIGQIRHSIEGPV